VTDYGFIRVSTGSQDAQTQKRDILKASPSAVIVQTDTKAASASKGEQVDAIETLTASLLPGDMVIVTDSSRLDRDPDQWAQMARLVAIKARGANVVDLANPAFGSDDRLGVVMTALHQMESADKSRTVKEQTYRGISQIRDNKAHHGVLPGFWSTTGVRYAKQAYCENPAAVRDIYERVANGESLANVGRAYDLYANSVKNIIRFAANHTGVEECSYTHEGQTETWAHKVEPVVDSPLWWRANKVLAVNITNDRANKGGRPVAQPANWISGVLDCPACGGKLYLNAGLTPQGNPRTPTLRCGGKGKKRVACGLFKGVGAQPIIDAVTAIFADDTTTDILAFQRVAGNAHELESLKANLPKLQSQLSVITDRATRRETLTQIEALEDSIDSFEIIPDDFDYAPTGHSVAGMWSGDDTVKRNMARAVKESWGLTLFEHEGVWGIKVGADVKDMSAAHGIVDLGNGLCFRRKPA
jgi:DNA invertase Pin-like site-specific DNA recombinase